MAYGDFLNAHVETAAGDFSRPTKFTAQIIIPASISGVENVALDLLCKSISVPNIKMDNIEVKYKGHSIFVPGRVDFEHTISVTFYLDAKHKIREQFKNWIESMDPWFYGNLSEDSVNLRKKNAQNNLGLLGGLTIIHQNFSEDYSPIKYTFSGLYPTSVSGPEYNTDSPSTVNEITVEFSYTEFKSDINEKMDLSKIGRDLLDAGLGALGSLFGGDIGIAGNKERLDVIPATFNLFKKFIKGPK